MGIETVTKKTVEILSVHPSNVCVKEPPAQRDDSGRIILKRNEGGFADQDIDLCRRNERRIEKVGSRFPTFLTRQKDRLHSQHTWTTAEEEAISSALTRLATSKCPNTDDDDNSSDEDTEDSDGYRVGSRQT
jgi:hypothetical protein